MDTLSTEELNDIAASLAQTAQETMAVCPEGVFKEIYLPVFSGQVINERAVNAWIYMAGGPLKRVKVVNDAENEVLFEVPSWFSTDHMSITAPKDTSVPSFGETVAQALMCIHHSPHKATEAFQEATLSYLRKNIDAKSVNPVFDEWAAIFERYGISQESIIDNFKARLEAQKNKGLPALAAPPAMQGVSNSETLLEDGFVAEE